MTPIALTIAGVGSIGRCRYSGRPEDLSPAERIHEARALRRQGAHSVQTTDADYG